MDNTNSKTIEDVLVCPYCGSSDVQTIDTDEIDFSFGNTHYYADCSCSNCKASFRFCMEFSYEVKNSWTRCSDAPDHKNCANCTYNTQCAHAVRGNTFVCSSWKQRQKEN